MKLYEPPSYVATYEHPTKGAEDVKIGFGFSWPGFVFGPLWAITKGLWVQAAVVLVVAVAVAVVFWDAPAEMRQSLAAALGAVCAFVFGVNGNRWRAKRLVRRGYLQPEHVPAPQVLR